MRDSGNCFIRNGIAMELLGETLLALRQYAEAREVRKSNLTRTPNKAVSVRALGAVERTL